MKKILLILAMVLFAVQAWGLTYYDSSADTTTSYETIAEMMAAKTMDDDDIIDLEGGTFAEGIVVDGSGTKDHPWIIQGPGSLTNPTANGILVRNKSWGIIRNLTVSGNATNGITVDTYVGSADIEGITIENVTASNNGSNGIVFVGYDYKILNFAVSNSHTNENNNAGIQITGNIDTGLITNCSSYKDSADSAQWGIIVKGSCVKKATGWTQEGAGTIYSISWTDPVVAVSPPLETVYGYLENCGDITPDPGEYYYDEGNSKVYVNTGANPNSSAELHIISAWCENVVVQNCEAHETQNPYGTEGIGMGFEVGAKNCTFKNNYSYNNDGGGFSCMVNAGCSFIGNIAANNENNGFAAQRTENVYFYNNTSLGNNRGIYFFHYNSNIINKNNIFYNNTEGIKKEDSVETLVDDSDYNCFYGNTTQYISHTKGANSITTNPRITSTGKLYNNSPCKDAGVVVPGVNDGGELDIWGNAADTNFCPNTASSLGTGWSDTGDYEWTCDGTQSAVSGVVFTNLISVGKTYSISYTISSYSAGSVQIRLGDSSGTDDSRSANGTYTYNYTPGPILSVFLLADADFEGVVTINSIIEVPNIGAHYGNGIFPRILKIGNNPSSIFKVGGGLGIQ